VTFELAVIVRLPRCKKMDSGESRVNAMTYGVRVCVCVRVYVCARKWTAFI